MAPQCPHLSLICPLFGQGFPCGSKGDTQDLKPKSDGDSNFQPQQQWNDK